MNTSTIVTLLQVTASLLSFAHGNAALPASTTARIAAIGNQAVQLVDQQMAVIPFSVVQDNSIYPNANDLLNAPYLNAAGEYAPLNNQTVQLDQSSISFGDLNGDGLDDAAAIVYRSATPGGSAQAALAFFLNQNGIMFNIADRTLGASTTVYSHNITNGELVIDMQVAGEPRGTFTYSLVGNQIEKE